MRAGGEDRGDQHLRSASRRIGTREFAKIVHGEQPDQPRICAAAGRAIAAIGAPVPRGTHITRQHDYAAACAYPLRKTVEPCAPRIEVKVIMPKHQSCATRQPPDGAFEHRIVARIANQPERGQSVV